MDDLAYSGHRLQGCAGTRNATVAAAWNATATDEVLLTLENVI